MKKTVILLIGRGLESIAKEHKGILSRTRHITNTLALPIDNMLYIYYCVCTLNTKTICSNLNSLNTTLTKETSSM
jgi:hypothetical protein